MVEADNGVDAATTTAPTTRPRPWPRVLRWASVVGVLLVLALVAGLTTSVVLVRKSWPQTSGELTLNGLEGEVRVVRDDAGIPQIYADSTHDLMLAQGFVAAQDRFFEMDVRRHATAGRLSELFGDAGLESDLVVRTLGWREVAEDELPLLKPATRSALDAYAQGVNAYMESRSLSEMSLEYTLLDLTGLDYKPEKWTAVDSIAWLKAMAWDLRGNLDEEIGRALASAAVGPERAADLYPSYPYDQHQPIVQQGGVVGKRFDQDAEAGGRRLLPRPPLDPDVTRALASVRRVLDGVPALLGKGDGIGSNAWVVDGDRTDTGAPILANDPHLGISLPGVWTQVGLHCRSVSPACPYDVAGFSFSGVPGVVIGHNRDIAWGFTNLGPDVTDLYVERVRGDTWQYDGQQLPLTLRKEKIEVKGGDDVEITVRSTSHGPLLSDLASAAADAGVDLTEDGLVDQVTDVGTAGLDDDGQEHAVSLAWTALTPRPTADALLALDRASDWNEFRAALSDFAAPGQNVVYADTQGHIGYQATGLVPIRRAGNDGRLPAAGWRRDTDWTGRHIPYDALPHVLDPASGIIATANQAVIDPGRYAPYLTSDWDLGYRSNRIDQLLAADDELSVDAMSAIQLDDWSAIGEVLTPYLLEVDLPRGYYSDGQRLLRSWNYREGADSAAAAYFNAVWRQVLHRTFADELPEGLRPDGGDRWFAVVSALLPRARATWWDDISTDDKVERRNDILRASMIAARDELTALESPDTDEWSWGRLHRLELRSATLGESGIGIIERLFNRGGWKVGGGSSLVNATSWDAREGYEVTTAPSMRMVVPLDDLDAARWVNLTGVSGHAFHPNYTDQTDLWARGETLPWAFSEDDVDKAGEDVLVLKP
ncbi:penicillin acylase family protein [Pimelobacter simplex]|uniref:penicillin acylase family protein n=1 Tax=Nocardioides simplex TaxID=2045 RepID=UPI002150499A|nr:penicillin acylase family protein [Pimelobacter simplex]UUW91908.1 penicillin acylase family protein [Pimelobacter simplex]UUW95734.1 penicillin acylase family protein [Pimelobacter simplex]